MSDSETVSSYPLASLQAAMLVNHLRAPRSGVDVVQMVCTLRERVDATKLRTAWERVSEQHDALRTSIRWDGVAEPRQEVHASEAPEMVELDWSTIDTGAVDGRLSEFLADDRARGFALDVPPLQRVALIRLGAEDWRMVWTFHHIVMDGRSFPIVLREMFAAYEASLIGDAAAFAPRRPYRDFVEWFEAKDCSSAEPFWRERMRGLPAATPLPVGFPDGAPATGKGLRARMLAAEPTASLERFARANGLTMNNIVQGAWALLLSRHSGEEDVVFGATRACRKGTIEGADDIVGMLINTLPVRVRVRPESTVVAWLAELRETWRSMFDVEHTPLRLVQRWGEMGPRAPIFDSQVVFESLALDATLHADGGAMATRGFHLYGGTNFAMTVLVFGGRELSLELDYDRSVVDDATAERVLEHLATIFESIAARPDVTVGELSMLSCDERRRVVTAWNDTAVTYPADATLVTLMSAQATLTPDATAVVAGDKRLTFAELDLRALALAHRLRALGVGPGALVAVCAERSVEMVIALVAVVKAGAAYVPLDPDYPRERLAFMLDDADAPVLLAPKRVAAGLPSHGASVVWLDDVADAPAGVVHPLNGPGPDDAAYMIYTSGSTGRPKGALNAHRGIVNRLLWMQSEYALGSADVVLQKTPFSFDVSVWEFFWPLLTGATLVMARPGGHRDAGYLIEEMTARGVTVCHFVPSMLRAFLADEGAPRCSTLRDVMASGEALPPDLVASFYRMLPGARLHNLYGPTECAVDVSYWPCPPSTRPPAVVPIGRPVANTELYVLDARGEPCPIGVAGELYLAGVQVGLGYHRRPALTAEKFVADPFARAPGGRMYRTGDRARWRPDGTVEYLGRLDFQVKLRGFRIELGEIEIALALHPQLREAAVVVLGDAAGEQRLVAYVVADDEAPSLNALRDHLAVTLPAHMVPSLFVWLPSLPLSSNGKVDRRSLPSPALDRAVLSRAFVAPRTPVEEALAAIWAHVLGLEQVGVEDNLFELGGDSLLAVQILSRARNAGLGLTLTQVLRYPTIGALARVADVATARVRHYEEVIGPAPLTPVQHWFFEGQREEAHYWNQAFLFTVPAAFDAVNLQEAVAAIVDHHDSLRLRFACGSDGWQQSCVAADARSVVDVEDLGDIPEADRPQRLNAALLRLQASLDLSSGPLIRVGLFRLGTDQPGRLLIAVHHLAIDGVSWRVLREDLEAAYLQRARSEVISLPPRTTPFSRWAALLAEPSVRAALADELSFWESVGSPEFRRVPRDFAAEGDEFDADTDTLVASLDAAETRALLQEAPSAYNTQINDALLAALAEAFGCWIGAGELVVNMEGHGREDVVDGAELSRTMGWFTTIFPIRLPIGSIDIGTRLKATKELLRSVPRRGVGYGILRYLGGAETLRAQTTPDVVFNYLGQFDQVLSGSTVFGFAGESTGSWYGPRTRRRHLLEVNCLVLDGRMEVRFSYSRRAHRRETIEGLSVAYATALRSLIRHCTAHGVGGYTPSDFPLARLDQSALDQLTVGRRDIEDIYPLVPMQRLFLGYADPASDPGFEQWRYRLRGTIDVAALHAAWNLVTARHGILRTAFVSAGVPEPLQVVHRQVTLPWSELDLRGLLKTDQERRLDEILAADRFAGFAFDQAPLMRMTLVQFSEDEYELVWSNHHLLLDRWSWPLVLLEIARAYPLLRAGERPALDPAPSYADFVAWQQSQSLDEAREFWSAHFHGFAPPRRIAPSRIAADATESDEVSVELTRSETTALHALARSHRVAANSVMLGAWALWLARRAGHDDVSFGVSVAGRDGGVPGIDKLVGLTINNLPLRVRVDRTSSLTTWLGALQESQAEVQRFAHAPLERVQEWSGVPWRTRLFDTLLVFQHDDAEHITEAWLGASVRTELVHVPTHTAYPLSVMIAGTSMIALRVTFDQRYFDTAAARAMAEGFRAALLAIISAPDASLGELLDALPLPAADIEGGQVREYVAPRTATEAVLAALWGDLLGAERVGVSDNFFALGGYSLVATQIVSRVRATLQLDVPVRVLFAHPTVASFAEALTARERKPGELESVARLVQRVLAMSLDELRRAGTARTVAT